MLPSACISLLTETAPQKQTLKLQTPPWLQELWLVPGGGGGNNGSLFRKSEKIKKKGGLARLSMPAEEMVSMQLFSQKLHLVGLAAKQRG